jgi:hypothetical protein
MYTNFALDGDVHDELVEIPFVRSAPDPLNIRADPDPDTFTVTVSVADPEGSETFGRIWIRSGTEINVPKKSVNRSLIFRPQ